ncbi:MAG: 4-(cytidine 5'-diphospho)-2-C-methyl-D-erythritol kinase [Acidimicrobiia bacterium]|nr:4-(cytidine 5'-diphospho)-2-C-methyl-D-erythritol kinase [Acidimicrobiia bacterium]MDH5422108.1 4-(cytidine 5'-diphospho)-2-C-methyl-D-erythritol kinase [Acidimicrobiia bacterium]MDH5503049.1 4-(cytidine 5'-diphospho)-2-C-methyl-D-erythritol kinase [Acidimicrobiia bacterium]
MIRVEAPAKLNFSLRVGSVERSGFHPLDSLVQTINWQDELAAQWWEDDILEITGAEDLAGGSAELPTGTDNLIWKAAEAFWQSQSDVRRKPMRVRLNKQIPTAAGLAGGSADAAATLVALAGLTRRSIDHGGVPAIGSDVPFALLGGTARMEGYGEQLTPVPPLSDFSLVVAVPPVTLSTPAVYREWDRLGGPAGPAIKGRSVPPSLRGHDLVNDLYRAAISLAPELVEHRDHLGSIWGREVAMSGSGPSLFGFFGDLDEAQEAAAATSGMRAVRAVDPVSHGARVTWDESDYTDTVR